jgi:hypothetical protein
MTAIACSIMTTKREKHTNTWIREAASEFIILKNGDCLSIIGGDLYITKKYTSSRTFTKDIQLNSSDEYEYSPLVSGNYIIYRRSGNYYLTRFDTTGKKYNEVELTKDESDSISYQIIAVEETVQSLITAIRILFAKYDNSNVTEFVFPDYTNEFVTARRHKKGVPEINLIEKAVALSKGDSLFISSEDEIKYPAGEKFLTIYSDYSRDASL